MGSSNRDLNLCPDRTISVAGSNKFCIFLKQFGIVSQAFLSLSFMQSSATQNLFKSMRPYPHLYDSCHFVYKDAQNTEVWERDQGGSRSHPGKGYDGIHQGQL